MKSRFFGLFLVLAFSALGQPGAGAIYRGGMVNPPRCEMVRCPTHPTIRRHPEKLNDDPHGAAWSVGRFLSWARSVRAARFGNAPPLPKPRFLLTDTSGVPFDFWNRTRGSVTLLFFGYTNCPDQCPMHMMNVGEALKKLPGEIASHVTLVFVTTDPARDTPVQLRRWLDIFDKHFIGLTGTEAALEAVQKAAGVPFAQKTESRTGKYTVGHANFVLAYTKDNLAHVIYPGGVSKDDWIHDLPLLVKEMWIRQR